MALATPSGRYHVAVRVCMWMVWNHCSFCASISSDTNAKKKSLFVFLNSHRIHFLFWDDAEAGYDQEFSPLGDVQYMQLVRCCLEREHGTWHMACIAQREYTWQTCGLLVALFWNIPWIARSSSCFLFELGFAEAQSSQTGIYRLLLSVWFWS